MLALTRREVVIVLLFAALGLLAWWYRTTIDIAPDARAPGERRPDYIVEDLSAVSMNEQGRPERRIHTPLLRHYPDDDSSELQSPVLWVLADDAPPWQANAEQAWVSADAEEILLQGQVTVEREGTAAVAPVRLKTSELLLLPDRDYAETDRFVEIESRDDWITATDGMRAWLGPPLRVRFFGRTRIYDAPDPAPDPDAVR